IAIEEQDRLVRVAADLLALLGREGGSEGGDHVRNAAGVQAHDIEIALHQDALVAFAHGLASLVQAEEHLALSVDRALGAVQVLGGCFARAGSQRRQSSPRELLLAGLRQGATAEGDDSSSEVEHGKHQAMTEAIVVPWARLAGHQEADALCWLYSCPLVSELTS